MMVLDALDISRSGGGSTLRMIREGQAQQDFHERQKYCYPFKEYDPHAANSSSRMSHKIPNVTTGEEQFLRQNGIRRATISQGTGHHFGGQVPSQQNQYHQNNQQNVPPPPPDCEPPPLPPKRTTSLFGSGKGSSATLTLLRLPKPRESSSLNPKRISIATSSFWSGHPDMAHFASGWEVDQPTNRTHSVWGTTERGGRPVTESVDIWGDPPAVKKGILLQQREKLWSRWKERYFILTRDYLNCFRRTTSVHRSGVRLSEMGNFIYKLRLAEVEDIEWETRKNGSLIALLLPQEPKILLRVPDDNYEALHQWFTLMQECIYMSKERRRALRSQHGSTHRSGVSYNPSKSIGSASPNSSSKSASNSDLDKSDGEKHNSLQKHISSSGGLLSLRKISGGSSSPKLRLSCRNGNGKYSPLIDDVEDDLEDEDDVEDELLAKLTGPPPPQLNQAKVRDPWPTLPGQNGDQGQEEFTVTLRRRREINNNENNTTISNTWKLSNGINNGKGMNHTNYGNINGFGNVNANRNCNGYATPIDARPRPESWTPQPTMFYRTSSLVPSQWINKREIISNNNSNYGCSSSRVPNFGRSSVIYCPSRVTSDVTFRKMS